MTKLTADNVSKTVKACLYDAADLPADGSAPEGAVLVRGIVRGFGFDPKKVESNKPAIADLLNQLPAEFHAKTGGGWTILNACITRDGEHWGEHVNVDELFCLGIAAGLADWVLPRDKWSVLPGGMPYAVVTTDIDAIAA